MVDRDGSWWNIAIDRLGSLLTTTGCLKNQPLVQQKVDVYFETLERPKSIPVKRAECVLLGPPDWLAKQSEVELLGGGGSSVIGYPV